MKKLLVLAFAIVLAASSCTQTESKIKTDTDYSTAYVNEFTGDCMLIRKGFETGLPLEDLYIPLYEGDTLTTGADSRLEVVFDDSTVLKLDPNCSLVIKKLFRAENNETIIELIKGRVTAIVKKLTENEEFKVKTKMAMAAVKGTEFIVDASDEDTVAVFEGAVEVSGLDIKGNVIEKIIVKKEQETVITKKTRRPSRSRRFRKDFENRHQEIGELRGRIEHMRSLRHSGGAHEFKKERWKKRNEFIRKQRKQERGSFDFNRGDRRSRENFRYDSRGNRYERRSRAMEQDGFRDKRGLTDKVDMREESRGMNQRERGMKPDNRRREENVRDEESINKEEPENREGRLDRDRQSFDRRRGERGEERMERQDVQEKNEESFAGDNRERGKRPGLKRGRDRVREERGEDRMERQDQERGKRPGLKRDRDRAREERGDKEEPGEEQAREEEQINNEERIDNKGMKRGQGQSPQREDKNIETDPQAQETPVENTQIQQEPETEEAVKDNDRRGERQRPANDRRKSRDDKEDEAVQPENTAVSSQPEAVTKPAEEEKSDREERDSRKKR